MNTIKIQPDTRLKDILIEKERKRLLERASYATSLKNLLASIPKVAPSVIEPAVVALMDAADQYRASQPVVDSKGRRSKTNLAEARACVVALHTSLAKVQMQLSTLTLDAMTAIGRANQVSMEQLRCLTTSDVDSDLEGNFRAVIGKMGVDIQGIRSAVALAMDELNARPHKVADEARNILAYEVAVVFTDILKKTPSSASAKQLKENKPRGGAAYDRVLRATLKAAGVTDYDSGPLITAGLRLLTDKDLPSRN
jgi:hypothetical protein